VRRLLAISVITLVTAAPATAGAATIAPPLSTRGARIVDTRGRTVVLQGVNWFGFETSNHVVHGLWTRDYRDMLAQIRRLGFNTIRLPFSLEALRAQTTNGIDFSGGKNAALRGASPQRAMDIIIDEAARQGLFVVLDNHSGPDNGYTDPLWYGRGFSEDDWVRAWTALARRYRGHPNVIGADL
jgi:endoglucanase